MVLTNNGYNEQITTYYNEKNGFNEQITVITKKNGYKHVHFNRDWQTT